MELSPLLYHRIIRPKWFTKMYIHNKLEKHINFSGKKVLDFGAGTGANCVLTEPGNYLGIDTDAKRIHFAQKLHPGYQFNILQGNSLPIEDHSLDLILIVAVLHHIPPQQIKEYMGEFRRVLKEQGGQIIIIEPCFMNKKHICNWFMKNNDNGAFIQTEEGYIKYFTDQGFTCKILSRFRKCFFYNELFFQAN